MSSSSSFFTCNMEELTPTLSDSPASFAYNPSFTDRWTYNVFLNFRGEDTRNGFTGYLYRALCQKGIHTFIDDRLERGGEITSAILDAIHKSRIAIVILSVNYASSTFCLEELVKILECIKQKQRLVLPIFYKVDPSDVRYLRGSFREALARHEEKFKNSHKVENWKSALQTVANLSGRHYKEGDGYEYEFVEKIVEEVLKKFNSTLLQVAKYPVGLKSRVEVVISLLHLESNEEVVTIGIHGIGGIGKTAIACAVHNVIVDQFEGVCFLSDVREKSNKHGLIELQDTLLFELTGEKGIKIRNVRKGISTIKTRLCQKKVLLILDDVNSREQLGALAGGVDWFGMGSRIIITTRDKHLLDVYGVSRNYEVEELCFNEALELFSWNAFKKNEVDQRYASLANCVTNYCNGLPLALEIIGSNLFNKKQEEWKSAIDTYVDVPNKNIQSVLEVSYNDLEEIEKEIFLDIACFFNGYHLFNVKRILQNGRGYDPQYGIEVLVKKSLIKIDQEKTVKIHDLIGQMGKEIVRRESPSNPENWSRLWSDRDIFGVIEDDKGTDKIGALMLNLTQETKLVCWNGKAFKKMKNLKILMIQGACFSCEPKYIPNDLKVLVWESTLPPNFHSKNLAILQLSDSSIRLFSPLKNFESLTEMVLVYCQFLKQVPDVSGTPNLKLLNVSGCRNLIQVHNSVGFLDKLAVLDAEGCTKLRILPRSIKSRCLELLNLSKCFRLRSVPEIIGIENNIAAPYDQGCPITALPESLILYKDITLQFVISCGILMLPKLVKWNDGFQHFNKCSGDQTSFFSNTGFGLQ